jgi:hypothetical protein
MNSLKVFMPISGDAQDNSANHAKFTTHVNARSIAEVCEAGDRRGE